MINAAEKMKRVIRLQTLLNEKAITLVGELREDAAEMASLDPYCYDSDAYVAEILENLAEQLRS